MTLVVLLATFGLGLRHGIDWDHLAAITDITGTEFERRRSATLAITYALGHGAAVMVLGALAVIAGEHLPDWIDPAMERLVGFTLVALAVMLAVNLRRGNKRLVSRGMLLFLALRRLRDRARTTWRAEVRHHHEHHHDGTHAHTHAATMPEPVATQTAVLTRHRHDHVHAVDVSRYTVAGAVAVGVLHGVGAETGSQAVVLVSAAHVASPAAALAVLGAFVFGIIATTSLLAVGAAFGWTRLSRHSRAFVGITMATALTSFVVGLAFLSGHAGNLPPLLG